MKNACEAPSLRKKICQDIPPILSRLSNELLLTPIELFMIVNHPLRRWTELLKILQSKSLDTQRRIEGKEAKQKA